MSRRRIMDDPIIISTQTNAPVMRVLWDKGSYKENTFSASEARSKTKTYFTGLFMDNQEIEHFNEWEYFTGLTDVDYGNDNGIFKRSTLKKIKVPRSIINLGRETFHYCSLLTDIEIPNNVLYLGRNDTNTYSLGTVARCTSLERFVMPDSVIGCAKSSFSGCTNLKFVHLSNNLQWSWHVMNNYYGLFQNCSKIEQIENFPSNLTYLPVSTFSGASSYCFSLLENSWDTIETLGGFSTNGFTWSGHIILLNIKSFGNYNITNSTEDFILELGSNLTSILSYGLAGCHGTVIFRGTVPPTLANIQCLPWYSPIGKVYVPYSSDHSVLNAYKTANVWNQRQDIIFELDENGNIPE